MLNDYSQSSNFTLAAFYSDLPLRDYYLSLPEELQTAVNEHEDEIRSLEDLKQLVQRFRKLR